LRRHLYTVKSYLTAPVAAEQLHWRTAYMHFCDPRAFAAKERGAWTSWLRFLAGAFRFLFIVASGIAFISLMAGYGVALFRHSLSSWRLAGWVAAGIALALLITAELLSRIDERRMLKRHAQEYATAERESRRDYEMVLTELVLGEIRSQINQSRNSYDCKLRVTDAPGLAEIYSDEYRIESRATRRLGGLIAQMTSGGTIGLAGPRGAGKTSLIRTRCPEEIHARPQTGDVALFVSAPVEYAPREFVLHLLATLCRAYLRFRGSAPGAESLALVPEMVAPMRLRSMPTPVTAGGGDGPGTDLVSQARYYLKEVRYLQTFTTTLGASASWPAGIVGLSGQTAAAAAELSRPYPELVSEFCRFLRMVATEVGKKGGRVFIGIDELDKISDGEQAQRFINELKVVLGVPNCYYLIAVSENALGAYEMRGLPVRDAFDSAFDEVIHLGYLHLAESRELLSKRVVGMSEPFICLCHCLSGGLPRDLIRVARHVVTESKRPEPGADHLAAVCQRLIISELATKLHAIGIRWAGRQLRELESKFLYAIQQVTKHKVSADELCAGIHGILNGPTGTAPQDSGGQELISISELACYLYYLTTLMEVFTQDLSAEQVMYGAAENPTRPGAFDQLCLARQTLTTDPRRAWLTIGTFRREWELRPIQYPAPGANTSILLGR